MPEGTFIWYVVKDFKYAKIWNSGIYIFFIPEQWKLYPTRYFFLSPFKHQNYIPGWT